MALSLSRRSRFHGRNALLVFGLATAMAVSGCHCGKRTDEELLKERIDTTSVHLYVATKVAITKADASPEVVEVRRQLVTLLEILERAERARAASAKTAPSAISTPAPLPAASAAIPGAPAPTIELSASDMANLAVALWKIRSEGKRLVQTGGEDSLPPVLPILLHGADLTPELAELLDVNTEHAMFLLGLYVMKFDSRTPVPVPPEILLYEAWMTHPEKVKLEGFLAVVNAVKAVVYSQNELCDLAAKEARSAEEQKGSSAATMSTSLRRISKGNASVDAKQAALVNTSVRAVAHGAAGACYLQRDERKKAVEELELLLSAMHELGVPPGETALVRAYIAYEKGDHDAARKCLEEARDYQATDAETRRQIEELLKHVASDDDGAIRQFYGKAYFSMFAVRLVFLRLDRAGVFDGLKDTAIARTVRGYGDAVTGLVGSTPKSLPSIRDAKQQGAGLWERLIR